MFDLMVVGWSPTISCQESISNFNISSALPIVIIAWSTNCFSFQILKQKPTFAWNCPIEKFGFEEIALTTSWLRMLGPQQGIWRNLIGGLEIRLKEWPYFNKLTNKCWLQIYHWLNKEINIKHLLDYIRQWLRYWSIAYE